MRRRPPRDTRGTVDRRRCGADPSSYRGDQLVSDAPHGLDLRAGAAQLVAQLLHVHVDRARLSGIREAPHVLEELVAGEDDAGLTAERLEELELLRAQRDPPAA